MKTNTKVTPSSQVDSILPGYIATNYSTFVDFMEKSSESEERLGFGQDILQNLQKYRNFDTYKDQIVRFGTLNSTIGIEDSELTLSNGFGFPEENGVVLIDDEVILYQTREGNILYGLQRGASGTRVLPTLRSKGTYLTTTASNHVVGAQVTNLSVLFLVSMLETIHESYTPRIDSDRVFETIDRSILLQNVRDFFASKGSKLGIRAFFKMMFGDKDVEVTYPGDKMIKPSVSNWVESPLLRTEPFPEILSDPSKTYTTPDKLIGSEIFIKSYNDDSVYGRTVCDYVSSYPYENVIQYELYLNKDKLSGYFPINPATTLTRELRTTGDNNDLVDTFTITVETTVGFPNSGVLFIDNEGIYYSSKTLNQFLNCTRGYVSVETSHDKGSDVYGPYYIQGDVNIDGENRTSYSWPLSLVSRVMVEESGALYYVNGNVYINGPGKDDPSEEILSSLLENSGDTLMTQTNTMPNMADNTNYTYGIGGVAFNKEYVFVESSNFPSYTIGAFSSDNSIGPEMEGVNDIHLIPRRNKISENPDEIEKGTGKIAVAVDGVPFYSNEAPGRLVSGSITKISVTNGGGNYVNPTVVIEPGNSTATASISAGVIESISVDVNDNFVRTPSVRISSGEGLDTNLTFDNYGRLTGVITLSGGRYFNDIPSLTLVDSSGRGKGALITCTIGSGAIQSITVLSTGIDYNASTTTLQVVPVGSGATATADVQGFTYDRKGQIDNNPAWTLDKGYGFLYEDDNGIRSRFGYIGAPVQLLTELGDDGTKHSPLIGWAYDGNPIYGPYGYSNGVDDSEGIQKQFTAYVLQDDRSTVIPYGSTEVATLPPSTTQYPMGTFVEDYKYDPIGAAIRGGRLMSELDEYIKTDPKPGDYIRYQTFIPGVLGENNGKLCNTPEFPPELYPDGVFCYFVCTFGDEIQFPYVIGPSFHNRPVSQNLIVHNHRDTENEANKDENLDITSTEIGETYDITLLEFDYDNIFRLRNNVLTETKDELDININNVSSGSIDGIIVESGLPTNSAVGDSIMFDDYNMDGTGASAKVSHLKGEEVVDTDGYDVQTRVISHRQRIVIPLNEVANYSFYSTYSTTTLNGVSLVVDNYDYSTGFLDIITISKDLVQFGDTIRDPNNVDYVIPSSEIGSDSYLNSNIVGGVSTFISYSQPSSDVASAGDLWWSSSNGRLYVYYTDANTTPGSSNWVTAQPVGMRPFVGAGNIGIGTTATATPGFASPQSENFVSISTTAPSSRSDGTGNKAGDLWWSTHTGMLYIWTTEGDIISSDGFSSTWVATDPTAVVNREGVSNSYEYSAITTTSAPDYEQSVQVLISESSPTIMSDGSALTPGVLWWSPLNGKMYIYYTDSDDTSQWVICNPNATLSGKYGLNTIPSGDGGLIPDYISILPEKVDQTIFWCEDLTHFEVGDLIEFVTGAPGISELKELMTIESFNSPGSIRVIRGDNPIEIPNGTQILNKTRSIYYITTNEIHRLRSGDVVDIDSTQEDLNGDKTVVGGGFIQQAAGTVTIAGGSVTGVTITNPGRFYQSDFYVQFVGGGGVGAYGIARVSDLVDGGEVGTIDIIEGGVNYTSEPTIVWPYGDTTYQFYIYTDTTCDSENTITYDTSSENCIGEITRVELLSGGLTYSDVPRVIGTQKKFADKAIGIISLIGTKIDSVSMSRKGNRYTNPTVIILDADGKGTGATATAVIDRGMIDSVIVTNQGSGYVDPRIFFIEEDGKFICTTKDIGKIESYEVINPGRNISADKSLNPEIKPQTRLILQSVDGYNLNWDVGATVYQGPENYKQVIATVISYDSIKQILTVEKINGNIRSNENLYGPGGAGAKVVVNGQSDSYVKINSISTPAGKFVSDTTKLSSENSAIQDSKYYQWFSYEIKSQLQQIEYESFVKEVIHPAGFELFSRLGINEVISSSCSVSDIQVSIVAPIVITTEISAIIMTELGELIAGDEETDQDETTNK